MIDLTVLVMISTIGIIQSDGSFDTEWTLELYEEHELYEYQMRCSPQTAGCTERVTKYIAMYLPFKDQHPMWGGYTVLNHEILHAQGLNHEQIRDCCPNPVYENMNYVPYDKSPKFLHSMWFNNELRFK
jgi:hypothetical protein